MILSQILGIETFNLVREIDDWDVNYIIGISVI